MSALTFVYFGNSNKLSVLKKDFKQGFRSMAERMRCFDTVIVSLPVELLCYASELQEQLLDFDIQDLTIIPYTDTNLQDPVSLIMKISKWLDDSGALYFLGDNQLRIEGENITFKEKLEFNEIAYIDGGLFLQYSDLRILQFGMLYCSIMGGGNALGTAYERGISCLKR